MIKNNLNTIIERINKPSFKREWEREREKTNVFFEKEYNEVRNIFQNFVDKFSPVRYEVPYFEFFSEGYFYEALEKNNENFKMFLRNIDRLEKYLFE